MFRCLCVGERERETITIELKSRGPCARDDDDDDDDDLLIVKCVTLYAYILECLSVYICFFSFLLCYLFVLQFLLDALHAMSNCYVKRGYISCAPCVRCSCIFFSSCFSVCNRSPSSCICFVLFFILCLFVCLCHVITTACHLQVLNANSRGQLYPLSSKTVFLI